MRACFAFDPSRIGMERTEPFRELGAEDGKSGHAGEGREVPRA